MSDQNSAGQKLDFTDRDLDALRELTEAAGRLALELQAGVTADLKRDGTVVTEADLRAEDLLREGLAERFPGVAVVGEEGGATGPGEVAGGSGREPAEAGAADLAFYLDPIDGTLSYARGSKTWAVSVGLLAGGTPFAGIIAMPAVGETWSGVVGRGAWCEGRPVRRGPTVLSHNSLLSITTAALRLFGPPPNGAGHLRCHGSIAWELALCADNQIDAVLLARWKSWDVVGGAAILQAAGGLVVEAEGGGPLPSWTGSFTGEIVAGGLDLPDLVPEALPGWRMQGRQ